jgi:hypothetical protein
MLMIRKLPQPTEGIYVLSECIRKVNIDFRKIFERFRANLLTLNPAKSMVLPIYRGYLMGLPLTLFVADDFIRTLVLLLTMI